MLICLINIIFIIFIIFNTITFMIIQDFSCILCIISSKWLPIIIYVILSQTYIYICWNFRSRNYVVFAILLQLLMLLIFHHFKWRWDGRACSKVKSRFRKTMLLKSLLLNRRWKLMKRWGWWNSSCWSSLLWRF